MNKVKLHKHLQTKAKETYKHSYARQYNTQTKRSKQKKRVIPKDFIHEENGAVTLTDDARRLVLTSWQERKKDVIEHPYLREKMTIGMLTHIQARLLAQHTRGSLDAYPPMIWK